MAERSGERGDVHARIVYWGPADAGKSSNLREIHRRLRPDHRGRLRQVPTPADPRRTYEVLPIELGEIAGSRVQIQIVVPPGDPEQAPTRRQLLDGIDGVVLVVDSRPGHVDANLAALAELREALEARGHSLEQLPLVVQYNRRDECDDYTLEALHRRLALRGAPVFEAVATEGKGVLPTLTTISKRVIRRLREQESAADEPAAPEPALAAGRLPDVEQALLEEQRRPERAAEVARTAERAEALLDGAWPEVSAELDAGPAATPSGPLSIESVGLATPAGDAAVRLPLQVRDASGRRFSLALTVRLDLLSGEGDEA